LHLLGFGGGGGGGRRLPGLHLLGFGGGGGGGRRLPGLRSTEGSHFHFRLLKDKNTLIKDKCITLYCRFDRFPSILDFISLIQHSAGSQYIYVTRLHVVNVVSERW
jgi:hypothetical protein